MSPPARSSSHDAPRAKLSTKLDQHRLYRRTDTQFPESLAVNFFVSPGSLAAATETMPFPKGSGLDTISDPAALKTLEDTTSFSGDPGKPCFSYACLALVKATAAKETSGLVIRAQHLSQNSHR